MSQQIPWGWIIGGAAAVGGLFLFAGKASAQPGSQCDPESKKKAFDILAKAGQQGAAAAGGGGGAAAAAGGGGDSSQMASQLLNILSGPCGQDLATTIGKNLSELNMKALGLLAKMDPRLEDKLSQLDPNIGKFLKDFSSSDLGKAIAHVQDAFGGAKINLPALPSLPGISIPNPGDIVKGIQQAIPSIKLPF